MFLAEKNRAAWPVGAASRSPRSPSGAGRGGGEAGEKPPTAQRSQTEHLHRSGGGCPLSAAFMAQPQGAPTPHDGQSLEIDGCSPPESGRGSRMDRGKTCPRPEMEAPPGSALWGDGGAMPPNPNRGAGISAPTTGVVRPTKGEYQRPDTTPCAPALQGAHSPAPDFSIPAGAGLDRPPNTAERTPPDGGRYRTIEREA